MPLAVLLVTAFFEGLCVLLIEIVGARAMAPYFGTSLMVWTAQITATLLFLALGYRFGGVLSRRPNAWHLPLLFATAGSWLIVGQMMRFATMGAMAAHAGIAAGSFASAAVLFGIPLMALGAVSPVIIGAIDRSRPGAGSAAGSLFFINTLGGLAGGWATAFLVIPYLSVSASLTFTGAILLALASFWVGARRSPAGAAVTLALFGLGLGLVLILTRSSGEPPLRMNRVVYSAESGVGHIQVVDYGFGGARVLLLDNIAQDAVNTQVGRSLMPFSAYVEALSHHYAPHAKRVLLLGLGAGVVAKTMSAHGAEVTGVDIEPKMAEVARAFFSLPPEVDVVIADGRPFLKQSHATYDLIILDVFAGENSPWHLTTVEAFEAMADHLAPGGRVVINTITEARGDSPGLQRMEAALLRVFPEAMVFPGLPPDDAPDAPTNVTVVAGANLDAPKPPAPEDVVAAEALAYLLARQRPARSVVEAPTDEWSDVDYLDAALRSRWRLLTIRTSAPIED